MAVFDKFINYMKLGDNEDEGYDDDYSDYEEDPVATVEEKPEEDQVSKYKSFPGKSQFSNKKRAINMSDVTVCVFKPTTVEESHEIMATFKENKTIVLNLEEADASTAQRILDFTSGCCFALNGSLQKISNFIFIATPSTVDVTGDLQDTLAASFSNM